MKGEADGKPADLLTPTEQAKESWRKEADLPTLRSSLVAEVMGGKIVVVGGMRGFLSTTLDADPMKTVEVYDVKLRQWIGDNSDEEVVADFNNPQHLPQGRHSPASALVPASLLSATALETREKIKVGSAKMMILGGGYGTRGDMRTTIGLPSNGKGGEWIKLPMLRVPRMGLRMTYSDISGCVYAMGGMTFDTTHHDVAGSRSPITGVVEVLCPVSSTEMEEL
jgi:hypothetical protein